MSQHTTLAVYKTPNGKEIEVDVLMGWDSPLQNQFLVVEVLDIDIVLEESDIPEHLQEASEAEEGIIYSNLFDPSEGKDLAYFRNKLKELDITVPESMFTECEADEKANEGNRVLHHGDKQQ